MYSALQGGDPILFINNPPGIPDGIRRQTIDQLNRLQFEQHHDPETMTRIRQYEMAYRMQASVPELTEIHAEPESTFELYGETDDFSYNVFENPVHIRDLHATILHLLGFDHERLTYRYQGLDQRLTGVLPANKIDALIT